MIKKIIHISDLHIRTFQLHELYRSHFKKVIRSIKDEVEGLEKDEIRIVITGDIAHQKINISNEQILLTSFLLTQLARVGKVIIIPGNHDFLENNTQRVDSITPIVELLSDPDITYYKDRGIYEDENIKWIVFSLYTHNQRPEFEKDDKLHVGLFHGPIQGLSTDLGFEFENAYDRLNFVDIDLLLCGDIHKRQVFELPNKGKAVMVGSLIQQNFGETIKYHGYGSYDVEENKYKFIDIENEQPYMHFKITDIKDIENEEEELLNLG